MSSLVSDLSRFGCLRRFTTGTAGVPRLWGRTAALLVAVAGALPRDAGADDAYTLRRRFWSGQRLSAEETVENAVDTKAKAAGPAGWSSARTGDRVEAEARAYTQEMTVAADGRCELRRAYEKAMRASDEPGSTRMESRPTSLQGKTVVITNLGNRPRAEATSGKIAFEDQDDVLFAEGLYDLLPKEAVKAGAVWTANGEALSRLFYGATGSRRGRAGGTAKGSLHGVAGSGDHRTAELRFQFDAGGGPEHPVQATLLFAVDDGTIVGFEMAGPVSSSVGVPGLSAEATGRRVLRYKAKITARGEPAGEPKNEGSPTGRRGLRRSRSGDEH
ncbi:MAG: hypothetical protein HYZ53_11305 [Planctomycetes bacterium]|nr:hypothetical protein [Planctomycetota bacterium]